MLSPGNRADSAAAPRPRLRLPGATAAGIASGSQLVESTSYFAPRSEWTAAPGMFVVLAAPPSSPELRVPAISAITADEYPVLAGIWDNDADDIFGTV